MFRLELSATDIAESRFAVSPLLETAEAVRGLAGAPAVTGDPALRRWLERKRHSFEKLRRQVPAVGLLAVLYDTREFRPRFLTPPPHGTEQTAARQLEMVRSTPLWQARAEFRQYLIERGRPVSPQWQALLADPDIVGHLAAALDAAWQELIQPDWQVIRAALEQDIQHRATRLVTRGWTGATADLSPLLVSRPLGNGLQTIEAPSRSRAEHHRAGGGAVLFHPTVFGATWVALEAPWHREMSYPARGRGNLLRSADPAHPGALGHLIGRTRADLLADLETPATTTQLSRQHRLALGTTGHHLSALRAAGLVARVRDGQSVIYRRTTLGDALVNHACG